MIRFLLATLVLPLAFATHIPLPTHPPKGMSRGAFKMDLHTLRSEKQFDLSKYGFKLNPTLRYAGSVDYGNGVLVLTATSPMKLSAMIEWYQGHMKGWRIYEEDKGIDADLAPKAATKERIDAHLVPELAIVECHGGTYGIVPCGSYLRFYSAGHR